MGGKSGEQPVAVVAFEFKAIFQHGALDRCALGSVPALRRKIPRQHFKLPLLARQPVHEASPIFRPIESYALLCVLRPCGHLDLASLKLTDSFTALFMIVHSAADCKGALVRPACAALLCTPLLCGLDFDEDYAMVFNVGGEAAHEGSEILACPQVADGGAGPDADLAEVH